MEKKFTNIDELFKIKLKNHEVEPPAHLWNNISQELDNAGNIDDIFKKSLQHNEVTPPAYVWDNINASLDKSDNNRKTRIWWMLGSGAAVIAAFTAGYFIAHSIQKKPEVKPLAKTHHELLLQSENNKLTVTENTINKPQDADNNLNLFSSKTTVNVESSTLEFSQSLKSTSGKNTNSSTISLNNNSKTEKTVAAKKLKQEGTPENNESNTRKVDLFNENQSKDDNTVFVNEDIHHEKQVSKTLPTLNHQSITEMNNAATEDSKSNQNSEVTVEVAKQDTAKTEQTIDLYEGLDPVSSYYPVFSVSPFFSPMYAIRNSFNDESKYDPIVPGGDDRFKHTTRFSYQAGVLLGYNFSRNISIHIGCSYNQITHSTTRGQLQTIPFSQAGIYDSALTVQTSAGELTGISVDPNLDNQEVGPTINIEQTLLHSPIQQVVQTIGFVEVPVLFKYRIASSRVGFLFTGGFGTGFIVRNDAFAENQTEYVRFGETANIRNVNFNLVLGAGMDVQITPWMYFTFEPTFRYSLMNWSMKEDVKVNPIMIGANTGLSFRF